MYSNSIFSVERYSVLVCALLSVVIPVMVLVGWAADVTFLKSIVAGLPQMKANTAIGFVFAGIGLWLIADRLPRVSHIALGCGGIVFLLGLLTLSEYTFGIDLRIDNLFIEAVSSKPQDIHAGRMSPHSAFNFTLLGLSIILTSFGSSRGSEVLLTVIRLVTVIAVLGILYGAEKLYGISNYNSMAVHTAALFLIMTTGLGLVDSRSKLSRIMASTSAGGTLGRRIIPMVLLVPPIVGLLLHAGFKAGLYDASFRLALTIAFTMIVMSIVIYRFSISLDKLDERRHQAESDLADKEARYRELFDYSQGLICIHDPNGIITTVNRAALSMLEYTEEELVGKNLRELVRDEHHPHFDAYLRQVTNEGLASGLLELQSKTGKSIILRFNNILAVEDGKEPYVLGHAQNVTELVEVQQQLKNLSLTDELTGLYNRRGFLALAEQQLKLESHNGTARGLSLLFADMDGLKAINDTYGHEAGSEAIATLAILLKSSVRDADVAARWGGDEFVVLTIGAKGESPQMMVDRINERLDQYNSESGLPYRIACSIGVSQVDLDNDKTFEEMITAADEAMYAEKSRRKAQRGDINALAQPERTAQHGKPNQI